MVDWRQQRGPAIIVQRHRARNKARETTASEVVDCTAFQTGANRSFVTLHLNSQSRSKARPLLPPLAPYTLVTLRRSIHGGNCLMTERAAAASQASLAAVSSGCRILCPFLRIQRWGPFGSVLAAIWPELNVAEPLKRYQPAVKLDVYLTHLHKCDWVDAIPVMSSILVECQNWYFSGI